MTAPIPLPELMAPLAGAPSSSEAPTTAQQLPLAEGFSELLGICLAAAPATVTLVEARIPATVQPTGTALVATEPQGDIATPKETDDKQEDTGLGSLVLGGPAQALCAMVLERRALDNAPAAATLTRAPEVAPPPTFVAPEVVPPPTLVAQEVELEPAEPTGETGRPTPTARQEQTVPQEAAPAQPSLPPELAVLLERTGAVLKFGKAASEADALKPPASPLAFAARLTGRSGEPAIQELLAVLASPELSAQAAEATPRTPAEAAEARDENSAAEAPVPADPEAPESPAPRSNPRGGEPEQIALRRQPASLPRRAGPGPAPEAPVLHRPAVPPAHPAWSEPRTPPMAPYRAPAFVATQPGTRTPWSNLAELPGPRLDPPQAPVHELSVVLPAVARGDREHAPVQVRVVERAGEVNVAVHTPDAQLSQVLREGLQDLVQRLERSGYHAEAFSPADRSVESVRPQNLEAQRDPGGERHRDAQGSAQHHARQQRHRQQDQPGWVETLANAGAEFRPQEDLK